MNKGFDRLSLLNTFVRIAESGSISAAARDLGISQPSASRHLVELESSLKTQLIRRNTHSLALTDAGIELLRDARAILADWESLAEKHLNVEQEVKGSIKVVAPVALGQIHLARIATEFQLQYPNVRLSWQLEDAQIRFTEVGCDCWIKVGRIDDDTLIVRSIATVKRILVCPQSVLAKLNLVNIDTIESLPLIGLEPFEGDTIPMKNHKVTRQLQFSSVMQTNNIFAMKEACKMGLGAAILPAWFIDDELNNMELVNPIPEWEAPRLEVQIAFLPNRYKPLRLRLFIEHLESRLKTLNGFENKK